MEHTPKIDIFPHILPDTFYKQMCTLSAKAGFMIKRTADIPVMIDVEARFRVMDRYPGYQQVLTLPGPPLEVLGDQETAPELARIANDGMAELVERHPDRFVAFVASLPMNDPDAALREIDRVVKELGARGIQIYSNVNGKPLDRPEFRGVFSKMAELDLPIWLHPTRAVTFSDYPSEPKSHYEIWWAFGWPYETSAAMARLVFAGIFEAMPNLKIITHHMGGMAPYFEGRLGSGYDVLGARTAEEDGALVKHQLKRRPLDYFKMFYADTALFGAVGAMECGFSFFGADHLLFGTDMPFDPEGGPGFIRDTIRAIGEMRITESDRAKIYELNARRLLKLPVQKSQSNLK